MEQSSSSENEFVHHKFKELKVYSSTEWLSNNKKRYRQVFDKHDTSYVYAELSMYNKLFDETDWEIDVELKCFSLGKGQKEVCSIPIKRKVSKYDNIIYVREGWGNKKIGTYWKKGTYFWEAWVDGEKIATKYFYIEDANSPIDDFFNPYMTVSNIQLYEGTYDDKPDEERLYFNQFDQEETRYIYVDIKLDNLLNIPWQCELFVKFYNESKELKGQVVRLHRVQKNEKTIEISAGWGSNVKGSWREGKYTAEVVFMNKLIATVPFYIDDEFANVQADIALPYSNERVEALQYNDNETWEEVLEKLQGLVGLSQVKQKVKDHAQYLQFLQLRKDNGIIEDEDININAVFTGNPGTGKTTVAMMMGKLYKKMGLLSKGHIHEVDRVDLVGEYIGQTAPKVKEAIAKAKGGILFIDEAYALARSKDDTKDFGREVIEILIKEMSKPDAEFAVIAAGYPKEMKFLINSNPGLKSRFKLFYDFADYTPDELSEIAIYACKESHVKLSKGAQKLLDEIITNAYRNRDKSFGNARYVHDLIEKAKINLGLRVMAEKDSKEKITKSFLSTIKEDDIKKIGIKNKKELPNLPIDEKSLQIALKELNALIGLTSVKQSINELVQLVRFYKDSDKKVLNKFYLHTVLVGNPGTGKTTVARILTKIYKALSILERGHMVETDRQGLVAGFVGQTAIKTAEKIEAAQGGVLFIDEAYSLSKGFGNNKASDFGDEAIETILKQMEDSRGSFFIFAAGYPDQMEQFLKTNPGLKSRFDKILKFEDYTPEELMEIADKMVKEEKLTLSKTAKTALLKYLTFLHEMKDNYFGNARTVRQTVKEVIKNQNLRLAAIPKEKRTNNTLKTITKEDLSTLSTEREDYTIGNRTTIGFSNK